MHKIPIVQSIFITAKLTAKKKKHLFPGYYFFFGPEDCTNGVTCTCKDLSHAEVPTYRYTSDTCTLCTVYCTGR